MIGSGPALGYFTAASLTAYIGCFAIGLGPAFWLLISEVFPMIIRARGMSAATIANWVSTLVVALTFLDPADLLGHAGMILLYAAMTFGGLVFAYLLIPKTKGLSLEAVQALWAKRSGAISPLAACTLR